MAETINFKEFSAGWCPSDDAFNARPNCLLKMDNLELGQNGALTLGGGTAAEASSGYGSVAHRVYSKSISGATKDYAALANGNIVRSSPGGAPSTIGSGGDSANAAFASAFNYVLAASGNTRLKDTGSGSPVNLGITPPSVAPVAAFVAAPVSTGLPIDFTAPFWKQFTTNNSYTAAFQSYNLGGAPFDMTAFSNSAASSGNDIISWYIQNLSVAITYTLDFLLVAGDAVGTVTTDYYTTGPISVEVSDQFQFFTFKRSQLSRVGTTGGKSWATIYGVRFSYVASALSTSGGLQGLVINGPIPVINRSTPALFFVSAASTGNLSGQYDYAQMNLNVTSYYQGKSVLGPIGSISVNSATQVVQIAAQTPADAQVNQVWIFRRGGNLQQWYRVAVLTSSFSTPFTDNVSDDTAQLTDITVNLNLVSIASSTITDKIYDIIGPIEGRWFYFTTGFMYPSDINDPDLVDVSLGIRTTGSTGEIFLWARKVADGAILVGTSEDVYLLEGTFVTLPDGTVDVYYKHVNCKFPPIAYDADTAGPTVYYLANDGWRSIDASGANTLFVVPNTDRLYRNITCYGYTPPAILVPPGTTRFPVMVSNNKLWCCITGTGRIEVFDLLRKYWRPIVYGLGDVTSCCSSQDGSIHAAFSSDNKLRSIDLQGTNLLIDGSTKQPITLLTPVFDGGTKRQRKDLYTFRFRGQTLNDVLTVAIIDDTNTTTTVGTIATLLETDAAALDISQIVARSKWFQIQLTGSFGHFTMTDMTIDYDNRPIPLTFLRIPPTNFGNACKKRLRVWPIVIDTVGGSPVFHPTIDNVATTNTTLGPTTDKATIPIFYKTGDIQAIDYGATIVWDGTTPFEFYGMMPPDIVHTFPIVRQMDQMGPINLFRYAKVRAFEWRAVVSGGFVVYTVYMDDYEITQGTIKTIANIDVTYMISLPQGVAGQNLRIVIEASTYNIYTYSWRIQVARSGVDTDLEWIPVPGTTPGAVE